MSLSKKCGFVTSLIMSTVITYSMKKDGETNLSTSFKVKEFVCQDNKTDEILICTKLVTLLQAIRDHFNKPVIITSAYRTQAHNKAVGGSTNSQHLYGKAADIQISGESLQSIADYAKTQMEAGGVAMSSKMNFVHVDTRDRKKDKNGNFISGAAGVAIWNYDG